MEFSNKINDKKITAFVSKFLENIVMLLFFLLTLAILVILYNYDQMSLMINIPFTESVIKSQHKADLVWFTFLLLAILLACIFAAEIYFYKNKSTSYRLFGLFLIGFVTKPIVQLMSWLAYKKEGTLFITPYMSVSKFFSAEEKIKAFKEAFLNNLNDFTDEKKEIFIKQLENCLNTESIYNNLLSKQSLSDVREFAAKTYDICYQSFMILDYDETYKLAIITAVNTSVVGGIASYFLVKLFWYFFS